MLDNCAIIVPSGKKKLSIDPSRIQCRSGADLLHRREAMKRRDEREKGEGEKKKKEKTMKKKKKKKKETERIERNVGAVAL